MTDTVPVLIMDKMSVESGVVLGHVGQTAGYMTSTKQFEVQPLIYIIDTLNMNR